MVYKQLRDEIKERVCVYRKYGSVTKMNRSENVSEDIHSIRLHEFVTKTGVIYSCTRQTVE